MTETLSALAIPTFTPSSSPTPSDLSSVPRTLPDSNEASLLRNLSHETSLERKEIQNLFEHYTLTSSNRTENENSLAVFPNTSVQDISPATERVEGIEWKTDDAAGHERHERSLSAPDILEGESLVVSNLTELFKDMTVKPKSVKVSLKLDTDFKSTTSSHPPKALRPLETNLVNVNELTVDSPASLHSSTRKTRHPKHSRRESLIPALGLDFGSAPPNVVPPTARPVSVHIRPASIIDSPPLDYRPPSPSPIDDLPQPFSVARVHPSVYEPRTSFSSSRSSLNLYRTTSLPVHTSPYDIPPPFSALSTPSITLPVNSPLPTPPQNVNFTEDELDVHPLYLLLSNTNEERLKKAFATTELILLPPRRSLPEQIEQSLNAQEGEETLLTESLQDFVVAHALVALPSKDTDNIETEAVEKFSSLSHRLENFEILIDREKGQVNLSRLGSNLSAPQTPPSTLRIVTSSPVRSRLSKPPTGALAHTQSDVPFPISPALTPTADTPLSSSLNLTNSPLLLPVRKTHTPSPSFSSPALIPNLNLNILNEMSIYRRKSLPTLKPKASMASLKSNNERKVSGGKIVGLIRKDKVKFKAPKWLRASSFSKSNSSPIKEDEVAEPEVSLQRLRLLSVDIPIVKWQSNNATLLTENSYSTLENRQSFRSLPADLFFLLQPPAHLQKLGAAEPFRLALTKVISLAQEFCNTFVYVTGFDEYIVKRIRRGIMDAVWEEFLAVFADEEARLFQTLENVTMACLYPKIFVSSLQPQYSRDDRRLDAILTTYRGRQLDLSDFGVIFDDPSSLNLDDACVALKRAIDCNQLADSQTIDDVLSGLNSFADADQVSSLLQARTPFDCTSLLKSAIDTLVKAGNTALNQSTGKNGHRIAPDDLIPLLAYVIMVSEVRSLESWLFWVKTFGQTDLGAEYTWSLATMQAAITYLRIDPFQALPDLGSGSSASSPAFGPVQFNQAGQTRSSPVREQSSVLSVHFTSNPESIRTTRTTRASSFSGQTDPVERPNFRRLTTSVTPSTLQMRRSHSGRVVPIDLPISSPGLHSSRPIVVQPLGQSEEAFQKAQKDFEDMPPPNFIPDHSQSASRIRGRTRMNSEDVIDFQSSTSKGLTSPDRESVTSRGSSEGAPNSPDVLIRPQIILRSPPHRPPTRSFHTSQDLNYINRSPEEKSPGSTSKRQFGHLPHSATSLDMKRSKSEGMQKRLSVDSWNALGQAPSETSMSPRSVSPVEGMARSTSLSSEIDQDSWWGWSRKRLSSVASSSSILSLDALSRRNSATDPSVITRTRKNSIIGEDILTRRSIPSDEDESLIATDRGTTRPSGTFSPSSRPCSVISMSSASSLEADTPVAVDPSMVISSMGSRRRSRKHSQRLRRELLVGNVPLPPRLDTASALSFNSRYALATSLPSPIREVMTSASSPTNSQFDSLVNSE